MKELIWRQARREIQSFHWIEFIEIHQPVIVYIRTQFSAFAVAHLQCLHCHWCCSARSQDIGTHAHLSFTHWSSCSTIHLLILVHVLHFSISVDRVQYSTCTPWTQFQLSNLEHAHCSLFYLYSCTALFVWLTEPCGKLCFLIN